MKYDSKNLNILDSEKKTLTLKSSVQLDDWGNYSYILFFLLCKFKSFASCPINSEKKDYVSFFLKQIGEINCMISSLNFSAFRYLNLKIFNLYSEDILD